MKSPICRYGCGSPGCRLQLRACFSHGWVSWSQIDLAGVYACLRAGGPYVRSVWLPAAKYCLFVLMLPPFPPPSAAATAAAAASGTRRGPHRPGRSYPGSPTPPTPTPTPVAPASVSAADTWAVWSRACASHPFSPAPGLVPRVDAAGAARPEFFFRFPPWVTGLDAALPGRHEAHRPVRGPRGSGVSAPPDAMVQLHWVPVAQLLRDQVPTSPLPPSPALASASVSATAAATALASPLSPLAAPWTPLRQELLQAGAAALSASSAAVAGDISTPTAPPRTERARPSPLLSPLPARSSRMLDIVLGAPAVQSLLRIAHASTA